MGEQHGAPLETNGLLTAAVQGEGGSEGGFEDLRQASEGLEQRR